MHTGSQEGRKMALPSSKPLIVTQSPLPPTLALLEALGRDSCSRSKVGRRARDSVVSRRLEGSGVLPPFPVDSLSSAGWGKPQQADWEPLPIPSTSWESSSFSKEILWLPVGKILILFWDFTCHMLCGPFHPQKTRGGVSPGIPMGAELRLYA